MVTIKIPSQTKWGKRNFVCVLACSLFMSGIASGNNPNTGDNIRSCRSLRSMARVYMACGDYAKAQPLAEQALIMAKDTNASDAELCSSLIDLAYLYKDIGRLDDAERMCSLGIRLQEKVYYKDHPYIAYTLRILSDIYQGQGRYTEAQLTLDRAMVVMLKSHPADEPVMAPFMVDNARLLAAQGNFTESEVYYQKALNLINNSYGPDHLYTATVLGSLASLYVQQERYAEAESLIIRTLAIQEKVYGSNHRLLAPTLATMAKIRRANGNNISAEKPEQRISDVRTNKQFSAGYIARAFN